MTMNDQVEFIKSNARHSLAAWLPSGKGTDRGAFEVDLVNSFIYDLFPILSDPGAEWSYSLSYDQRLLHDLLSETIAWPEGASDQEVLSWIERKLEEYRKEYAGER